MSVWGAGAITTCYFSVTFIYVKTIDIIGILQRFNADFSLLIIFFFCVVSYIVGAFLHEIGKRICELFPRTFDIQHISDIKSKPKSFSKSKARFKRLRQFCLALFCPIKHRKLKLYEQVQSFDDKQSIDEKIVCLKNKPATKIIDKYHSIYGLTRGIWIGFGLHIICFLLWLIIGNMPLSSLEIGIIAVDIFAIILFFVRTYRYYAAWIKSILIQFECIRKCRKNKVAKLRKSKRHTLYKRECRNEKD